MSREKQVSRDEQEKTLGELYSQITVEREDFGKGFDKKLEKRAFHPFVKFCKAVHEKIPSLAGKNPKFKPEFEEAIRFLDWPLKPEELSAAATFSMIASMLVFLALGFVVYFSLGSYLNELLGTLSYFYIFVPAVLAALLATYFVQNFPISEAKTEQVKALTYVPEIMGYMIMSMKLVPNLEKSVEFAAEHGRGKISEDFKKLLWDLELGVYNTLSEGLDELALRWGKFSSEFKESIMMVRASVLEDTEAKRYALLDKTMTNLLESVKTKMEQYARDLSQPSISLFYLGVLLPLILIIILPVGSAFSGQPLARTEILIFVYNILIPIMAFAFAISVIRKRPPTYEPPVVPDSHPLLPKKWSMELKGLKLDLRLLIVIVLVAGLGSSFYLHEFGLGLPSMDRKPACLIVNEQNKDLCVLQDSTSAYVLQKARKPANYFDLSPEPEPGTLLREKLDKLGPEPSSSQIEVLKGQVLEAQFKFYALPENDTSPQTLVFGFLIVVSITLFIYFYYTNIYKRRIQLDAMQVEGEFKEALYILASRMGENKPVEDAMKHVRDFLPTYKISTELFGKTVHNIEVMGMPLEAALFDSTFGSLKNNTSTIIRSSMRLVIDSVQLGVEVASRTIVSLSLQLTNQEKVSQNLKVLVSDVSQMMRLMSTFIGPAILGVTVSLQRVVMRTLANVVTAAPAVKSASNLPAEVSGFQSFTNAFSITPETMQALVSPTGFLLIVAVYVIEIVIILMYFTSKIEEDNEIAARVSIAKALPIAVIVFLLAAVLSSSIVAGVF